MKFKFCGKNVFYLRITASFRLKMRQIITKLKLELINKITISIRINK